MVAAYRMVSRAHAGASGATLSHRAHVWDDARCTIRHRKDSSNADPIRAEDEGLSRGELPGQVQGHRRPGRLRDPGQAAGGRDTGAAPPARRRRGSRRDTSGSHRRLTKLITEKEFLNAVPSSTRTA